VALHEPRLQLEETEMSRVDEILDEVTEDPELAKALYIRMHKIVLPWEKHNESRYSKITGMKLSEDAMARFSLSGFHVARVLLGHAQEPDQSDYTCSCGHLDEEGEMHYNAAMSQYAKECETLKTKTWEWAVVIGSKYEHGFVATQAEGMAAADTVLQQLG